MTKIKLNWIYIQLLKKSEVQNLRKAISLLETRMNLKFILTIPYKKGIPTSFFPKDSQFLKTPTINWFFLKKPLKR